MRFDRRTLLSRTAALAGGLTLGGALPRAVRGQTAAPHRRFLFAYFEGGWDLLLGLDPRSPATTRPDVHQIQPGYEQLAAVYQARGIQVRGNLRFGPAVPPELLAHASKLSVVNGVGMDTASHEAGRRYFLTGRFPRGIVAVGSSTPAELVAQQGDLAPIPHLSASVEAYATGLPSHAAALSVNGVADLVVALTPFSDVSPEILQAVQAYQDEGLGCEGRRLDREGLASRLRDSQTRARAYLEARLGEVFDLGRADPAMEALRARYGITAETFAPASPEVLAFVAGQALEEGISQCVSVRIAADLDTHSNWAADHPPRQERGWRALAAILSDLEATPLPGGGGESVLEATTVLAFSEFGRTPLINNLRGRDHFLGNSCLLAGAGIRPNLTVGGSASVGMTPLFTDLRTGAAVERPAASDLSSGAVATLSPKHVIATLFAGAGLDGSYLRTDPIRALLA